MKKLSENLILYSNNNPNNEIIYKIKRYILEKILLKMNQTNGSKYKQLVVYSFDYISTSISLDGLYEKDDLHLFIDWLKSFNNNEIFDGCVLDIGANIGNHSVFFSEFYKEIESYEPNPKTFQILKINSEIVNNIKCYQYGLSNIINEVKFKINSRNVGGSQIDNSFNFNSININLKTIDSLYVNKNKIIKLIKIDVEGHEYEVLKGGEITIKENMPIIIFEQHDFDFINQKSKVIELLKSYGYIKFASIEKMPYLNNKYPKVIKLMYNVIFRLINGTRKNIILQKSFEHKFYPFIIAIPNSLYLNN
jgi:FkbM family methyltransferase